MIARNMRDLMHTITCMFDIVIGVSDTRFARTWDAWLLHNGVKTT